VGEFCSLTTRENALYARRRALKFRIHRIVLVTCDFHMPRALRHFRNTGFVCVARPCLTLAPGDLRERVRHGFRLLRSATTV
jgi:uncharacterized SAM-binding protein YcdF (DUF218 family)